MNKNIKIEDFTEHMKASEKYVSVSMKYGDKTYKFLIPYYYRKTAIFLNNEKEIQKYLDDIYETLNPKNYPEWEKEQEIFWSTEKKGAIVTKPVFDSLKGSTFICNACSMPKNVNLQARVKDIKDSGYTLSTQTIYCECKKKKTTHHQLIYLPRSGSGESVYETISQQLRKKIFKVLKNYDAYEDNYHSKGLLPDHKFPEERWDDKTKQKNENLSDKEIQVKFQLLTNQRNLQKKEVCRKCSQTSIRGKIYGINFFYKGNEKWNSNIPKRGKIAEKGCVGCGWYDIEKWREELQNFISNK